jgi:tRNA(Ile)-lysidine synthase
MTVELKNFPMNKSDWSPIETTVWENIQQNFSDISSLSFVVAVSGGMDSMCLLHIFKELGVSALVSHINYQKRGEQSDKDARLVEEQGAKWGFECDITTVDPTKAENENFQQWARNVRYDKFRKLAKTHGANGIATAHHEDDQIETILQKIFRGAGLASWSGMRVWDGEIFRPLLGISRTQIEAYVKENAIPYRTDESNFKTNFARNFLRNEWLKDLRDFFPGWKQNVLRVKQQADTYKQALQWIANRITDSRGIERKAFHSLGSGLQKALMLFLIKRDNPALQISHDSLNQLDELLELQTGKAIQLVPGVSVLRDREYYVIEFESEQRFEPVHLEREQLEDGIYIAELNFKIEMFENPSFKEALYLDAAKISWPIRIRRWQPGDQFQPFGMEGHQQVSDHLTNRKISAAHKDRALVIESFEETIYAIIFPPIKNQIPPGTISEQVKCDTNTEKCLKITYRN